MSKPRNAHYLPWVIKNEDGEPVEVVNLDVSETVCEGIEFVEKPEEELVEVGFEFLKTISEAPEGSGFRHHFE